jgi:hypothetical protein
MTDLRVITSDGTDAILEEAAVHDFASSLRGRLLHPAKAVTTTRAKSGTA